MRNPTLMLTNTSQHWEVVGQMIRADGWWGNTDGLHTISVHYYNFIGGFLLQGTLAIAPMESDWFNISLKCMPSLYTTEEVRFPLNQSAPTGTNGGDTGVSAYSFIGNFVYLRARLVRSYLGPAPQSDQELRDRMVGHIDKVLLSL